MLLFRYVCIMKWIPYYLINKIIYEPLEKGNPFGKFLVVVVLSLSIPISILILFSHSCVNLSLCTVPVSSRTCLRVEKVQSYLPALLNMGV